MRVAARLDIGHPVGMEAGKMKRGSEEVAPTQAPEHRALGARENAREENRRARIVGELAASGNFVERAGRDSTGRQPCVERFDAERNDLMPGVRTFDSRNSGAKIGKDGGVAHGS